jgi:transcription-repair coupling factor (superfamily II helicase)
VVFSAKSETPAASALPDIAVDRRAEDPLGKLKNHLAGFPGRVLLLAESAGRRETLATMLAEHGLKPAASADLPALPPPMRRWRWGSAAAWRFCPARPGFITETELYAGSPRRTRREAARKASFDNWLKDLTELKIGDPVVHESHGIGRYLA